MLRARALAVSRPLADRCSGISIVKILIGYGSGAQGRAPDVKHDGLDDSGPKQQNARDQRNRTQPGRNTAGDKYRARDDESRRDDPEGARVFDGFIAF